MLAGKLLAASLSARPLPVFVSSSEVYSATSSFTVTAPTGIQDGDLLVAIGFAENPATCTPPSGFNVNLLNSTSSNAVFTAFKVASSESGSYSFTWGGGRIAILVYRNATRINTVGSISRSGTTTGTATSITPSYKGVLCGVFANGSKAIDTDPSGLTVRAGNSGFRALRVLDKGSSLPVASGDYSATWNGSAPDAAVSFLLQITNEPTVAPEFVASASTQNTSNSNTLTINKPTGTVEGDLMVAVMADGSSSESWTGDTGWTEVADQGTTKPSLRLAYKVAGASEGASYTFTHLRSASLSGCILTYRYAAYDTIGSFTTGTDPLILPGISPSESQSILIAAGARFSPSITLGTPTSMTARAKVEGAEPSYIVCDQTVAKGPTGTRSMSTGSTNNVSGIMLALKPTRSL